MIRKRMCNVVKCFASHRDYMPLEKVELLGSLEIERKVVRTRSTGLDAKSLIGNQGFH
jgi:hypothetical protein